MDFELIKQLEMEFSDPTVRKNRERLSQLFADNFEEVGKSGTRYCKADIIDMLLEEQSTEYSAHDFRFVQLSEECVLVKYVTTLNGESAHRCSIWKQLQGNWQIHYHQGTPFSQ